MGRRLARQDPLHQFRWAKLDCPSHRALRARLNAITFVNENEGWAVGDRGTVLHSAWRSALGAREKWRPRRNLLGVDFATREQGWIVGARGTILHTEDAGQSWHLQVSNTYNWLEDVDFTDEKHGVADRLEWHHPAHRGWRQRRWKRVDRNLKEWLYALAFADQSRGYAVGEKGVILRTDDGGATWKDIESDVNSNLFAVAVADRDDVMVTGDQGRILHTKDAGDTWEVQPTITSSPLFSVAYRGGTNIWVAGSGGAILKRNEPIATVKVPTPKLPPALRGGAPKFRPQNSIIADDGDIPLAMPPTKKPSRPR